MDGQHPIPFLCRHCARSCVKENSLMQGDTYYRLLKLVVVLLYLHLISSGTTINEHALAAKKLRERTASKPPKCLTVSPTIFSTSDSNETSPGTRTVLTPCCEARFATSFSLLSDPGRSFNATFKPSLASLRAIAFPIPDAAPVIIATRRRALIVVPKQIKQQMHVTLFDQPPE